MRSAARLPLLLAAIWFAGCAPTPQYIEEDCPTWEGLGTVRVNPAGATSRHLRLQAAFRVCPPDEGRAEVERKRIELRHEVIALLSAQTEKDLEDPLRAERLREQLMILANERVLRKSQVVDVFITGMELE
jgi:flagellar basal body-associated protein FliL